MYQRFVVGRMHGERTLGLCALERLGSLETRFRVGKFTLGHLRDTKLRQRARLPAVQYVYKMLRMN
jgi:hypothetical protein